MPYPKASDMKSVKMDSSTESIFLSKVKELSESSIDRNRDWFPILLERYNTHYDSWYLTFHKDELVAFAAVQLYDTGWYRLMTRMWNGIKKTGLERGVKQEEISPAMMMLNLQLSNYPTQNRFMSMEYLNRRPMMENLANKVNKFFGGTWKLNDGMYFTCPDYPSCRESFSCWQSTISEIEMPFDKININEFKKRFGNERKSKLKGNT